MVVRVFDQFGNDKCILYNDMLIDMFTHLFDQPTKIRSSFQRHTKFTPRFNYLHKTTDTNMIIHIFHNHYGKEISNSDWHRLSFHHCMIIDMWLV